MKKTKDDEFELIKKLNLVLDEFKNFEKAEINSQGDIIIKNKIIKKRKNQESILTNVFKQIINNDIRKNRI